MQRTTTYATDAPKERVFLAAFALKGEPAETVEASLDELAQLAETAGAEVCGRTAQYKDMPEKATLIGSGKVGEMKQFCENHDIDAVIFDNELSGVQIKNLTDLTGRRVIDRSMLILDIFAGRAESAEGKIQVELAQIKYTLPRLVGIEKNMAQMKAGGAAAGMRGPGEKKLETDRRIIRRRVLELEAALKKLEAERGTRGARRAHSGVKRVALVGYTNAGKSTLMNLLARAGVWTEDKLFATLDPVTRKVFLGGGTFTLTDTVGFISKLPHEFIDAFKSTLSEARDADLLLHIMDCASPALQKQYAVVTEVLKQMGIENKPVLSVYNKADLIKGFTLYDKANSVLISAKTGAGAEDLKKRIAEKLGFGSGEQGGE
ncbi:MAG: GTPase HflX [Clostridiales bacterium]|jgi:GTP-binding protein HflX|nr:GTPase HflX [Clostridiales bacterium]